MQRETVETEIVSLYSLARPKGMDGETWKIYQANVRDHIQRLYIQGWDKESIKAYGDYLSRKVRKYNSDEIFEIVKKCNADTQIVGSDLFIRMWNAWKIEKFASPEAYGEKKGKHLFLLPNRRGKGGFFPPVVPEFKKEGSVFSVSSECKRGNVDSLAVSECRKESFDSLRESRFKKERFVFPVSSECKRGNVDFLAVSEHKKESFASVATSVPQGEEEAKISMRKLQLVMKVSGMEGIDETSSPEEFRQVTARINPDLAPDSAFFRDFADTVKRAFLIGGMRGDLGKKVHLFRYILSDQQVGYIRKHYKGETDRDKLMRYCARKGVEWTAKESVRLHLKACGIREILPEGHSEGNGGINIKVLANRKFHAEFILNGDGKFLNLLDEGATQDAIVNCASFNYANKNDKAHTALDGEPPKAEGYEPIFREEAYLVKDTQGNPIKREDGVYSRLKGPGYREFFYHKAYKTYRKEWHRLQEDFREGVLKYRDTACTRRRMIMGRLAVVWAVGTMLIVIVRLCKNIKLGR